MALTFRGGVHPDDMKRATSAKALEPMNAPETVVLPVSMHIGAPCEPLVSVGDAVFLGQKVADSSAAVSSPVHSPVSGTVTAIEPRLHPNGNLVQSIIIENDFFDTPAPDIEPRGTLESLSGERIIEIIREAGIVGLGGAGFPTHVKIRSGIGKVDTLIINCAECEPYITSGYRGMIEHTAEIIGGIRLVMKALGLTGAVSAVEANKPDAVEKLTQAAGDGIRVCVLRTKYPQGGEKQLIQAVTGRQVPPGGLPADVGCAVFNPETCAAVWRAVTTGLPLVTCNVTVAGSAVANPKNLICRIGTPVESLFAAAGGFSVEPQKLINGGPMMGVALYSMQTPVVKTTNALLAFTKKEVERFKPQQCIHCGRCVSACPMDLVPLYINMYYSKGMIRELEGLNVTDCIECGSCAYICPARLPLTQVCRTGKTLLGELKKKENAAK